MSLQENVRTLILVGCNDPCLLVRVCAAIATVGATPVRLLSTVDAERECVTMEIDLADATDRQLDLASRKLSQLVPVESVSVDPVTSARIPAGRRGIE